MPTEYDLLEQAATEKCNRIIREARENLRRELDAINVVRELRKQTVKRAKRNGKTNTVHAEVVASPRPETPSEKATWPGRINMIFQLAAIRETFSLDDIMEHAAKNFPDHPLERGPVARDLWRLRKEKRVAVVGTNGTASLYRALPKKDE